MYVRWMASKAGEALGSVKCFWSTLDLHATEV